MANTSTVVVALPAKSDPINEFGPEQKHMTLLWFGEVERAHDIISTTRDLAQQLSPFRVEVAAAGELGEDDPPAYVLFLGDRSFPHRPVDIRADILVEPRVREQWESIKQYPTFKPHVTLGYGPELSDDDRDDVLSNVKSVTFDRLAVWHKDEQIEFPLGATLEGFVAAVRFVRTAEGAERFGVPVGSRIEVKDGKVVSLQKPGGDTRSLMHRGATAPPRPDPNRKPSKFVPTKPGQKAKIPGGVAGGESSNGLSGRQVRVLGDISQHREYTVVSGAERTAIERLTSRQPLGEQGKSLLRAMIKRILEKIENPVSSSSDSGGDKESKRGKQEKESASEKPAQKEGKQSAAEKAATAKRQKAGTEASAYARALRAAFRALGGDPKRLPGRDGGSARETAGRTLEGPLGGPIDAPPPPQQGFTGMNDKELTSAIRSLVMEERANPSSIIKNALMRARTERRRRDVRESERERRLKRLKEGSR